MENNTTVWLALMPGWLAFLVSIVVLVRSVRTDNRKEIMEAIAKVVEKQDRQSTQLTELENQHGQFGVRFSAHEQRDRELHAEVKDMFGEIKRMFLEFQRKPDHEEDMPATRRDVRHMKASIDQTYELLAERVEHLERGQR